MSGVGQRKRRPYSPISNPYSLFLSGVGSGEDLAVTIPASGRVDVVQQRELARCLEGGDEGGFMHEFIVGATFARALIGVASFRQWHFLKRPFKGEGDRGLGVGCMGKPPLRHGSNGSASVVSKFR